MAIYQVHSASEAHWIKADSMLDAYHKYMEYMASQESSTEENREEPWQITHIIDEEEIWE